MIRDSGNATETKKHSSRGDPSSRQNRKTFTKLVSGSSSASSHRNSSPQSEDGRRALFSAHSPKHTEQEDAQDGSVKKLQSQVKELRNKLKLLEECVDSKDYSLGTMMREKDRALGEVRRLERHNRQLKQQLNDERDHYLEEKEKFCEEMTRFKKRLQDMKISGDSSKNLLGQSGVGSKLSAATWQKGDSADIPMKEQSAQKLHRDFRAESRKSNSVDSLGLYEGQDISLQMAALRTENAKLRAIINEREERNCELCLRFLRMKHSKKDLRNRFQNLENEYLQVITNLMEKIDEAREEFNFIVDEKFKKPLHATNSRYLRMVQRNSKLAFENITLRMELQNVKKELNRLTRGQTDYGSRDDDADDPDSPSKDPKRSKKPSTRDGLEVALGGRGSDTDSNYMSKTSTTDPSTGSLGDAKSNDSFFGDDRKSPNRNRNDGSQPVRYTEGILNKLFIRVDSQSSLNSQARDVDSSRPLNKSDGKNRGKRASSEQLKLSRFPCEDHKPEGLLIANVDSMMKRFIACSSNSKRYHEVNANMVPKKDKLTPGKKDRKSSTGSISALVEKGKIGDAVATVSAEKAREKPRRWKGGETERRPKMRSHFTDVRDRCPDFEKTNDYPKEGRKGSSTHRRDKMGLRNDDRFDILSYDVGISRRYRMRKDRHQKMFVRDSCGLEEKLDSDMDLSPEYDSEKRRKLKAEKLMDKMSKRRTSDDVRDKIRERVWHEIRNKGDADTNSDDSNIAADRSNAKGRNRNSVSLHDELMEATKCQSRTDEPFWRRELKLHSLITKKSGSSSRTYRLGGRNSRPLSSKLHSRYNIEEEERQLRVVAPVETKILRKEEEEIPGKPSSPPEPDEPGTERSPSPGVSDKATGTNQATTTEPTTEVVLRVLMPPAAIGSTQSLLFGDACKEPIVAKPEKKQRSPQPSVQQQVPQLMLPTSDMPSSSSTMEVADSSAARENGLSSRTHSAPALLESEWLNTFKLCEVKDCSTNT